MNFIVKIALGKVLKKLVQGVIAYVIALNLDRFGIHIDDAQATVALFGLVEFARNWLKVKTKAKWL